MPLPRKGVHIAPGGCPGGSKNMEKNAEKVKWGGGIRRGGVIVLELWAESTLTAGGASVASFETDLPGGPAGAVPVAEQREAYGHREQR